MLNIFSKYIMPKTNRHRTTHRKRTSQRKRKNAKKTAIKQRGGNVGNIYFRIIFQNKTLPTLDLPYTVEPKPADERANLFHDWWNNYENGETGKQFIKKILKVNYDITYYINYDSIIETVGTVVTKPIVVTILKLEVNTHDGYTGI
jgi:hypothetical protein